MKTHQTQAVTNGFTLIEVLIYSALLGLLMTGVLGGVYMIIQATGSSNERQLIDDEANFVLRKINWALDGITDINLPASGATGATLSVDKSGFGLPLRFRLNSDNIEIDSGAGTYSPLDSENVTAASLSFHHIPVSGTQPAAVEASFYLDDKLFTTTKFIRK